MIETIFFFLFAALAVSAAIMVITMRNPVHSVVSLIVCFFQIACLFILLRAPFLAGAQIFVYVGAIMIFFVFAVFLLDIKSSMAKQKFSKWTPYGIPVGLLFLVELIMLAIKGDFAKGVGSSSGAEAFLDVSRSTQALGEVLFTKYLLPFEIISVVLLVGFIGAVVLTVKAPKED